MKNFYSKIWWLPLLYVFAGYAYPTLFRLRFMLVIFFLVGMLVMADLKTEERVKLVAGGFVLIMFFMKIIPSPYPSLVKYGIPMSISMLLTILLIFLSVVLAVFLSSQIARLIKIKD